MRIAIISPIYKSTPPLGYGGIERVVYNIVQQLVKDGHTVTLFGAEGSYCSGQTIEISSPNLSKRISGIKSKTDILSEEPIYEAMFDYFKTNQVDVIHDWSLQNLFVLKHPEKIPFVISTCIPPGKDYRRPNLVACSNAHAKLCSKTTKYVHYGLDMDTWEYNYNKKDHMIHIAKIAKYKAQHLAIKAARKTNTKLLIAGNIENKFYYYLKIKPFLITSPNITYIGEINGTAKHLLYATALVQTPQWFDAFPLVILESLASGTPVISLSQGGISEQIVNGVNGFLCNSTNDLIAAIDNIHEIKPKDCRAYAEEYFSLKRMSSEYTELYKKVIEGEFW